MTPIEVLKQRAHEQFHNFPKHWVDTDSVQLVNRDVYPFLDTLIDEVIATVEGEVVPGIKESFSKVSADEWGHPNGWNTCRAAVLQAFRTLKGEEK